MPTIRERVRLDGLRSYHVQVRQRGFPARTASFPTLRQAERWAKTIEADMIEGRHFRSAEARRRKIGEAIERYSVDIVASRNGESRKKSNSYLNWWKAHIGKLRLAEVTSAVLVENRSKLLAERFSRARPDSKFSEVDANQQRWFTRSPATVNRYMAALSHVFTIARREWHWMSHNPFDGISKFKESKGSIRFLKADERRRLLAETAKDQTLHLFTVLALSTACRAGELLKLIWRDVDLEDKRLLFREPKNGQTRTAWLHGEAYALLKKQAEGAHEETERVFRNASGGVYDYHVAFEAACSKAAVTDFRFHDLRHSAATYLAREGASEQQLRAIGGWKSSIVSRYVHIAAEDARSVVRRMNRRILGG